jgi:hypothetical protein
MENSKGAVRVATVVDGAFAVETRLFATHCEDAINEGERKVVPAENGRITRGSGPITRITRGFSDHATGRDAGKSAPSTTELRARRRKNQTPVL